MGCGGLCQTGSGGGCPSCALEAASHAVQGALFQAQSNRQVLGGMFGRRAGNLAGGFPKGLGQIAVLNPRNVARMRSGPAHHRNRGLGQAAGVVDVNPADYVNVGWDQASATSMAQLDNNYNAGAVTQPVYIASAQAITGSLAPTSTVDENAADYAALGWSNAAAQAAANAATDFNAGTTTLAQFQAAMTAAVGQMFAGATVTVAPSAAQQAAGVSSTGLTPAGQAAVDQAAITGAASVLNQGIAGVVASTKGTTLASTAGGTPSALTPSSTATALTTNQKIGIGVGVAVAIGGILYFTMGSKGGRRRRRR